MSDPDDSRRGAQAGALVSQMAISTLVLGGLGWLGDARLHTAPWLLLIGLIGGFTLGMVSLFAGLKRLHLVENDTDPDPDTNAERDTNADTHTADSSE